MEGLLSGYRPLRRTASSSTLPPRLNIVDEESNSRPRAAETVDLCKLTSPGDPIPQLLYCPTLGGVMQESLNIGIDVAKAELVIGVIDHPELNCVIANTAVAIKRWLRQVPQDARIAVEATGGYHNRVAHLAQQRGVAVYVLNARDVHHYVKALGLRGKTDRTDAQAIGRFLREHHSRLRTFSPAGQAEHQVEKLLRRRARGGDADMLVSAHPL